MDNKGLQHAPVSANTVPPSVAVFRDLITVTADASHGSLHVVLLLSSLLGPAFSNSRLCAEKGRWGRRSVSWQYYGHLGQQVPRDES